MKSKQLLIFILIFLTFMPYVLTEDQNLTQYSSTTTESIDRFRMEFTPLILIFLWFILFLIAFFFDSDFLFFFTVMAGYVIIIIENFNDIWYYRIIFGIFNSFLLLYVMLVKKPEGK